MEKPGVIGHVEQRCDRKSPWIALGVMIADEYRVAGVNAEGDVGVFAVRNIGNVPVFGLIAGLP